MERAPTPRGARRGRLHPLWAGLTAALAALALMQTAFWRQAELRLFDFLVVRTAPNRVDLPITIVGIDEATFETLKTSWPLPRRYHAALLDKLKEAGVAVVGFDMLFANASAESDDAELAAAIKRFGSVVLASDLSFREDAFARQWFRVDPYPAFLAAGARKGYAALQVDEDAVLRRVPAVGDSFWRAVLEEFRKTHPDLAPPLDADEDLRIRYLGGPHTFTYIPYHQMLDPDRHLAANWREFLNDNIVLVGRNPSVIQDVGAAQAEVYQTPFFFFLTTGEFMPRVEAHANVIANMVSGDALREAPARWALAGWLAAVLAGLALMRRWHPLRSAIVVLLGAAALAAIQYGVFERWKIWFPAAGAAMSVALIYVSQGAIAFFSEQRRQREIRNAFSMYVSPALVDQVIAHPELLKLGGERRQLTILFSDLAGFTTISEQYEPEKVSAIVNRHLSEMTETIIAHSGTVEKFLGDGIMAFWGAPVADERQSERAVQAAIEMQQRMDATGAELLRDTGAELHMRIGVNRGECIVGNMGGNNRFDYTAIGDAVNLASRLEGANKAYGTRILVSEAVVAAVGDAIRFREVDSIRVKGKHIGITVFTPSADEALNALSAQALAAYRERRFDEAEKSWLQLLAACPDDPVAKVFRKRIATFRELGVPDGWNGVTALEEK